MPQAIAPNLFELDPVEAIATAPAQPLQIVRYGRAGVSIQKQRATGSEITVRRAAVLRLRLAHTNEHEIARQLGISAATVCRDLQAIKGEWAAHFATTFDPVAEVGESLALYELLEGAAVRELTRLEGTAGPTTRS